MSAQDSFMWSDQSCEQALAAPLCQRETGGMTTAESTPTHTPTSTAEITTQGTTEAEPSNPSVILLAGGFVTSSNGLTGHSSSTVELFPPSPSCGPLPPLATTKFGHVTFTHQEQIYTCGGCCDSYCERLDLGTNSWVRHSRLNLDYRERTSFGVINGQACIFGGEYNDGSLNSIECLSGDSWNILPEAIPGAGVYNSCSAPTLGGGVLIVGGQNDRTQVMERLSNGYWDTTSWDRLPIDMYGHSCSTFDKGTKLMVTGGYNLTDGQYGNDGITSTLIIDLTTRSVTIGPDMNHRRMHHATVALGNKIYVLGGSDPGPYDLASIEVYDEASGVWTELEEKITEEKTSMGFSLVTLSSIGC